MIQHNITLDLCQHTQYPCLHAKQGDNRSRFVRVRFTNGGEDYWPQAVTANLRARKPDGTMVFDPATLNEDGTVTLELSQQLLAAAGSVLADVCLCGIEGEILSSASFVVSVELAPAGDKVDSTNEFLTLMEMVKRVEGSLVADPTLTQANRAADAKETGDRIRLESARINQLAKLKEGSTTGDAELQDLRIGWDGTEYVNAGTAIRTQMKERPGFIRLESPEPYSRQTSHLVQDGFYSITASQWDDLPCSHCLILVFRYSANYVLQLAVEQGTGRMFNRIVNRNSYEIYRDWASGMEDLKTHVDGMPQYHYLTEEDSVALNRLTASLVEDGFYCTNKALWDDIPDGNCLIQVFRYAPNFVVQIATEMESGKTYNRVINRNDHSIYRGWVCETDALIQFRAITDSAAYERLTSKIVEDGFYSITTSQWDDFPLSGGGALLVMHYAPNYVVQIAVSIVGGNMMTRIVHRATCKIYRDWASPEGMQPTKVLALGDSICRGYRNNNKGFAGDLGLPYKNIGLSSATLSNHRTDVVNIPNQLVNLTGYDPDVIIANGGANDFQRNVPMGTLSAAPVTSDAAAGALDRDTVMGAVEYLFYQMITRYPKAQRFFLLTHKTTANLNGKVSDWTVTKNKAGYTQTELFDAIKRACVLYGVRIIDVFGESMINTAFEAYKSKIAYNDDASVTNTEFVDVDGLHPLSYGYLHGYVPLIKEALKIGTRQ